MTRTRRVISVLGAALLVLSGHSSEVRGQDSEVGVVKFPMNSGRGYG